MSRPHTHPPTKRRTITKAEAWQVTLDILREDGITLIDDQPQRPLHAHDLARAAFEGARAAGVQLTGSYGQTLHSWADVLNDPELQRLRAEQTERQIQQMRADSAALSTSIASAQQIIQPQASTQATPQNWQEELQMQATMTPAERRKLLESTGLGKRVLDDEKQERKQKEKKAK